MSGVKSETRMPFLKKSVSRQYLYSCKNECYDVNNKDFSVKFSDFSSNWTDVSNLNKY